MVQQLCLTVSSLSDRSVLTPLRAVQEHVPFSARHDSASLRDGARRAVFLPGPASGEGHPENLREDAADQVSRALPCDNVCGGGFGPALTAAGNRRVGCEMTTSAALGTTTPLLKTSPYTIEQCKLDLYVAWGCKCKDASAGAACVTHEDMTCKEAGFSYYLAGLYERWESGMWLAGGVGFLILVLFVIIPAFKAAVSGSFSLVVFSACSGLWCGPFLVASGFFFAIAAAFRLAITVTSFPSSVHDPAQHLEIGALTGRIAWPFTTRSTTCA
jgi:hypothetical protein